VRQRHPGSTLIRTLAGLKRLIAADPSVDGCRATPLTGRLPLKSGLETKLLLQGGPICSSRPPGGIPTPQDHVGNLPAIQ
jgi:hypothetical protein